MPLTSTTQTKTSLFSLLPKFNHREQSFKVVPCLTLIAMLLLKRIFQNDKYTIGKLYIGDTYLCDTLEPPVNVNHPRIPNGKYSICYQASKKFGCKMPFLLNVPGRTGIMIHTGNYPRETQGCILVGRNLTTGSVSKSKETFANVDSIIKAILNLTGSVTITVM